MIVLQTIVDGYLQKKKSEVENEWIKHSEAEGDATAKVETEDKSKGLNLDVTGRLICSGMKMWTLEYGKGSKMDKSNPWLADYKQSEYWNIFRNNHGNTVRTRPAELYKDLDGHPHIGSGIMGSGEGVNIEDGGIYFNHKGDKWSFSKNKQVPVWSACHIVKEAMTKDNVVTQDFKQDLLKAFGQSVVVKRLPTRVVR